MSTEQQNFQIAEDATDWLLKLQAREDGESDGVRKGFIEWLKHSPRHVEEFLLMSATVRVVKQGGKAGGVDVEALLREGGVNNNVVPLGMPHITPALCVPVKRRGSKKKWAIAATVTVLLGAGVLLARLGANTYETPVGEQRSVKLGDGSLIYLNTRSRIKVEYSESRRDVRLLEGEALFVVARDAGRSFRVITDSAVVQALGTQFNVYTHAAATTVSVLEGRVQIAKEKVLGSGEQADVTNEGVVVPRAQANVEKAVAWRQRRLVFQSDSLTDIAREFNRYNAMQIRIEGEAAPQRRFTAVFNADDPQALLNFLRSDPALQISTGRDGVVIR